MVQNRRPFRSTFMIVTCTIIIATSLTLVHNVFLFQSWGDWGDFGHGRLRTLHPAACRSIKLAGVTMTLFRVTITMTL